MSGSGSTKERLSSIVKGFNDFDREMKSGTRQRRERDEIRISSLKTVRAGREIHI